VRVRAAPSGAGCVLPVRTLEFFGSVSWTMARNLTSAGFSVKHRARAAWSQGGGDAGSLARPYQSMRRVAIMVAAITAKATTEPARSAKSSSVISTYIAR